MPLCFVCEQENPEVARFCLACGAALGPSEDRREERKVVTVLFADLVGFTSRAEHLDPEDVRAVLAPYWERLRGELERHGGTVEKFIGDAVMALSERRSRTRTIRSAPFARRSRSATGPGKKTTSRCESPSRPARRSCCSARAQRRERAWRPATSSTPPRGCSRPRP
jgi:class 3 adenylate cyclase